MRKLPSGHLLRLFRSALGSDVQLWFWRASSASALGLVITWHIQTLISVVSAPIRWFNFYGFDEAEITNFTEVVAQSGKLVPCTYMGRMLLSARAERLNKDAELMAAHSVAAAPYEDPRVIPILVFADVYEVSDSTCLSCGILTGYRAKRITSSCLL